MTGPKSTPPDLPGCTYKGWLGGGGFADVFLYETHAPRRLVAIKVLRSELLTPASRRQFAIEADLMAEVSNHPYIVTILTTDEAADGRPYIMMEHHPGLNFGQRARTGPLSIAEVLRVGVQISSAVESAHRAGIFHRDIKPGNILTSAYGRPALTDFGIAGVRSADRQERSAHVSVAFAPREVLEDRSDGGVEADVYSLAATLYACAAGRPPFVFPGADNDDDALTHRTLTTTAPPLARDDAPPRLVHLLSNALSHDPASRPPTAMAFAERLQDVEQILRLPRTTIEELRPTEDGHPRVGDRGVDEDRTHRRPTVVRTDAPAAERGPAGDDGYGADASYETRTTDRGRGSQTEVVAPPEPPDVVEELTAVAESDEGAGTVRLDRRLLIGAASMLLVVILGLALFRYGSSGTADEASTTLPAFQEDVDIPVVPRNPAAVEVTIDQAGVLTATWARPTDMEGGSFRVLAEGASREAYPDAVTSASTSAVLEPETPPDPGTEVCVSVSSVGEGGAMSTSAGTRGCTTAA